MNTLQIVLFNDGRPGHEKQSKGILQSLCRYVELDIHELHVVQKGYIHDIVDHLKYLCHLDTSENKQLNPDLIIGTGSRTHIPVLSCKRRFGGYALTCMTPPLHIRSEFDLCFIPLHDQIEVRENIVQTIGPPNIAEIGKAHDTGRSMILVGGEDKHSHQWDSDELLWDISRLLRFATNQKWTISSSPRTPAETDRLLDLLVEKRSDDQYVRFSETGRGWVESQYSINKTVWVTGDSISMVYEALSAGCKVGIIPVKWNREDNKFRYSLDYLVDSQRVITLKQYLEGGRFCDETEPLNESDRCAKEILKRWWPENLP